MTLEDETAAINVIIWPDMFERFRRVVLSGQMLGVVGRLQKEGEVVHLVAREIVDISPSGRCGGIGRCRYFQTLIRVGLPKISL
ncbi:error-prone DNA polymerase [Komagataeibacter europaeus]|uniref:Error-prone DNA polymerase n=1 Tax=Komagataeibacter europaeus TaxID=33995 RepID=A0A0M0ED41_KOMEU|nr:error-prone DNA polymerase [Komagataeibacter europaeus]